MKKLILHTETGLFIRNDRSYCTSRQVAEEFGKEHRNVLRDIENLDCSQSFNELNFERVTYKDAKGESRPEYLLTKDGFTFLVMGYRGKNASKFKEAYIQRFNHMESFIKSLSAARLEHPAFTEAIMNAHEEPKHYHFSNEADLINRIVLGCSAKKFREEHGIEKGESIRPYLNNEQIKAIESLQRADIGLLLTIHDYEQRKMILTGYFERMNLKLAS